MSYNAIFDMTDIDDEFEGLPALSLRGKERVRELAEVFTAEREVNAMLDLVPKEASAISSRFLEPSCGNGNFMAAILIRKLNTVYKTYRTARSIEYHSLRALTSIYGIDIDAHNIKEARERMRVIMLDIYSNRLNTSRPTEGYDEAIRYVLKRNVQRGDMINGVSKIRFVEFTAEKQFMFSQKMFRLSDLVQNDLFSRDPAPVGEVAPRPYNELWRPA